MSKIELTEEQKALYPEIAELREKIERLQVKYFLQYFFLKLFFRRMSTISGVSFITGAQGWLTPGPGAPPPMTGSQGTQPPILTRSGRAT